MLRFETGRQYLRSEIRAIAGHDPRSKGGQWDTGIAHEKGEYVIFANVGTAGRTGHDYSSRWEGNLLRWSHKRDSTILWPSVQRLLGATFVHIFWRTSDRAPFTYAGYGNVHNVIPVSPVEVVWSITSIAVEFDSSQSPHEVAVEEYHEGAVRQVWVNRYERDRKARQACLAHHGIRCVVCGLILEERYGEIGKDYIHVHHLVPLSQIGKTYKVDPIKDLRPICPNCHAMVHRKRPPLMIEELKKRVQL
ncbi:MAG: HNH endonuclease [Caldilineaceae bacterium]|nr:HNH endonuclease [Caldilineaceae bacterium]MDE0500621.1 HNH endonuclease [bacterium]